MERSNSLIHEKHRTTNEETYVNENQYKVSAAWLIEKIGMKGYEAKDCGVSKKHSLVLVNFSQKSENIIHLSNKIRNEISKKFDITLEYEPTLIS